MNARLFVKRNASTILTGLGGIGVVATTITAVKATPKVLRLIEETETNKGEKLTKWEKVKTAVSSYIPSAIVGNRNYILRGYSYLNEFYEFLGIEETEYGSVLGWAPNDDGMY